MLKWRHRFTVSNAFLLLERAIDWRCICLTFCYYVITSRRKRQRSEKKKKKKRKEALPSDNTSAANLCKTPKAPSLAFVCVFCRRGRPAEGNKKNLSAVAAGSAGRSAAWGVGLPTAGGGREAGNDSRASPPAPSPPLARRRRRVAGC